MSRRLADRRERRPLPRTRARPARARGRVPGAAGAVRRVPRARGRPLPRPRLAARRVRAPLAEAPRRLPARRARAARREADAAAAIRGVPRAVDGRRSARQPSAGLGEDVRLRGEHVIGSGLELDGELIQLSAFRARTAAGARSAGSRGRAGGGELRRFPRWRHRPAALPRIDRVWGESRRRWDRVAHRRFAAMAADCGWRPQSLVKGESPHE